jgi:hypothetical protein
MVNYQNGKIYKIINENNEIIYIGSTAEEKLCRRYTHHEYKAPNHKIILIENYPCNNREELRMREQQVIEEHSDLLNKIRAYISEEQKKERDKLSNKEYRENNKDYFNQYEEKRKNNPERIEYNKKHNEKRKNDPEYIKKQKEYEEKRRKNPERIEYKKKHNKEYREKNQEYLKEYEKKRNEKITCEFCNSQTGKKNLKRHQKSMKCLKFQECMIIDDE